MILFEKQHITKCQLKIVENIKYKYTQFIYLRVVLLHNYHLFFLFKKLLASYLHFQLIVDLEQIYLKCILLALLLLIDSAAAKCNACEEIIDTVQAPWAPIQIVLRVIFNMHIRDHTAASSKHRTHKRT